MIVKRTGKKKVKKIRIGLIALVLYKEEKHVWQKGLNERYGKENTRTRSAVTFNIDSPKPHPQN